jgi:hypothetical protein
MRELCEGGGAVVDEPLTHMTVFPEPGEVKAVAKLLLALADHPNQVATTLDPTIGFKVPAWLYETFTAVWDQRDREDLELVDATAVIPASSGAEEGVESVKRKPGRPRKEVK